MSQLRRLKQKARKEYNVKSKRQKALFSLCFISTIVVSFSMWVVCAIQNSLSLTPLIISGSVWLVFDVVFAVAIKNKWSFLFDNCTGGFRYTDGKDKTEAERRKDNWRANCFSFAIAVAIFILHLVLFFVT